MAYVDTPLAGISLIATGTKNSQWLFDTADTRTTVIASAYFNAAADRLRKGDLITARCSTGGTETVDLLRVTSATGATPVTVGATALT